MNIDLQTYPLSGKKAITARDNVRELLDLMRATKKPPREVKLYPGDYRAIVNSIKRDFSNEDKSAWRHANANAPKGKQVKWAEFDGKRSVGAIYYGGIPVTSGNAYSKPRKVEA